MNARSWLASIAGWHQVVCVRTIKSLVEKVHVSSGSITCVLYLLDLERPQRAKCSSFSCGQVKNLRAGT